MIIRNSARCLKCGDEIESTHRHDYVTCSCGEISVDGGHDYFHTTISEYFQDTSLSGVFSEVGDLVKHLTNVHAEGACYGLYCAIHKPSDHHMRSWPVDWTSNSICRLCPHGELHRDPDGLIDECFYACDGCCE